MINSKIRIKLKEKGIKQWQLGRIIGKSESTVYRLLREELPEEEQDRIVSLIEQSKAEGDQL